MEQVYLKVMQSDVTNDNAAAKIAISCQPHRL